MSLNPSWNRFDRSNLMLSPEVSKPDLRLNSNRGGQCSLRVRRFDSLPATSGLHRTTDINRPARLVRFVPQPDIIRHLSSAIAPCFIQELGGKGFDPGWPFDDLGRPRPAKGVDPVGKHVPQRRKRSRYFFFSLKG